MTKNGMQPIKDLLGDAIPDQKPKTKMGADAPIFDSAPALLPPLTLRDAREAEARMLKQQKEDEGQYATDSGSDISSAEVDYIEPSFDVERKLRCVQSVHWLVSVNKH